MSLLTALFTAYLPSRCGLFAVYFNKCITRDMKLVLFAYYVNMLFQSLLSLPILLSFVLPAVSAYSYLCAQKVW